MHVLPQWVKIVKGGILVGRLVRIYVMSSGCVHSILRSSAGPVDLDRHTARGGPRFD
jgi:hypothetical protein